MPKWKPPILSRITIWPQRGVRMWTGVGRKRYLKTTEQVIFAALL